LSQQQAICDCCEKSGDTIFMFGKCQSCGHRLKEHELVRRLIAERPEEEKLWNGMTQSERREWRLANVAKERIALIQDLENRLHTTLEEKQEWVDLYDEVLKMRLKVPDDDYYNPNDTASGYGEWILKRCNCCNKICNTDYPECNECHFGKCENGRHGIGFGKPSGSPF
jgi:hypothetical protein